MPAIPLKVFITPFSVRGSVEPTVWTCDAASDALNTVNTIWTPANIQFIIQECTIDKPLDMAKDARNNDRRVIDALSLRRPANKGVNIFLLNAIPNLNAGGGSYLNSDPEAASFVQSYGIATASGRAWAHELGHLLSLDHVVIDYSDQKQLKDRSNLMVKGLSVGTDLNTTQIGDAKKSKLAQQFSAG